MDDDGFDPLPPAPAARHGAAAPKPVPKSAAAKAAATKPGPKGVAAAAAAAKPAARPRPAPKPAQPPEEGEGDGDGDGEGAYGDALGDDGEPMEELEAAVPAKAAAAKPAAAKPAAAAAKPRAPPPEHEDEDGGEDGEPMEEAEDDGARGFAAAQPARSAAAKRAAADEDGGVVPASQPDDDPIEEDDEPAPAPARKRVAAPAPAPKRLALSPAAPAAAEESEVTDDAVAAAIAQWTSRASRGEAAADDVRYAKRDLRAGGGGGGARLIGVVKTAETFAYEYTSREGVRMPGKRVVLALLVTDPAKRGDEVVAEAHWRGPGQGTTARDGAGGAAAVDAEEPAPPAQHDEEGAVTVSGAAVPLPPGVSPKNIPPEQNLPLPLPNGYVLTMTAFGEQPPVVPGTVVVVEGIKYAMSVNKKAVESAADGAAAASTGGGGGGASARAPMNPVMFQLQFTKLTPLPTSLREHLASLKFGLRTVRHVVPEEYVQTVRKIMGRYLTRGTVAVPGDALFVEVDNSVAGRDVVAAIKQRKPFVRGSIAANTRYMFLSATEKDVGGAKVKELHMCVRDADGKEDRGSDLALEVAQGFGAPIGDRVEALNLVFGVYEVDIKPLGFTTEDWAEFGPAVMAGVRATFVGSVGVDRTASLRDNMSARDNSVQANGSFIIDFAATLQNTAVPIPAAAAERTLVSQGCLTVSDLGEGKKKRTFVSENFSTYNSVARPGQNFWPLWLAHGNADVLFAAAAEGKATFYLLYPHDQSAEEMAALLREKDHKARMERYMRPANRRAHIRIYAAWTEGVAMRDMIPPAGMAAKGAAPVALDLF